MSITPIDIQQHQFKNRLFGYDPAGVDHFLELVAEELERLNRLNQELKDELTRTRANLQEMKQREATLKETLLTTQRVTDELKANARKEGEIIVADSVLKAEKIVHDAEARRIKLIGEIQELKHQKMTFETSLRSLVENHLRLLDLEVVPLPRTKGDDALLDEPLILDEDDLSEEDK